MKKEEGAKIENPSELSLSFEGTRIRVDDSSSSDHLLTSSPSTPSMSSRPNGNSPSTSIAVQRLESVRQHLGTSSSSSDSSPSLDNTSQASNNNTQASSSSTEAALEALKQLFPSSQLSLDLPTRNTHGSSWGSFLPPTPPTAVLHALSTSDVVKAVEFGVKWRFVIIPTGGRTALEGQFIPTCCNPPEEDKWKGGNEESMKREKRQETRLEHRPTLHVSLSRMDKVVKVYEDDFQAIVEPGVGWVSLNKVKFRFSSILEQVDR